MHSRIFQISENPIDKCDYFKENRYIDTYFINNVADYVDDCTNREEDIEWLKELSTGYSVGEDEFGRHYIIITNKNKFFEKKFEDFKASLSRLLNCTIDDFAKESSSFDLYMANRAHTDKSDFYVDDDDEFYITPFDTFVRNCVPNKKYYIGSTIDYHS